MRVTESCVISCAAADVYDSLSKFDFSFWSLVESSAIVREGNGIGISVVLTFKDKTVQTFRAVGMDDFRRSVTLELVDSTATTVLSLIHCISVYPVTKSDTPTCFVEWETDFSFDAGQDVLQDSRYKKLEAFADMQRVFGKK